jgi:hypothetical protein
MHIMDIFQNSIKAESSCISLDIEEDTMKNLLTVVIRDNGKGIEDTMLDKVTDPFFTTRTTRKVGLGLSLLKQNVERTGGTFLLNSQKGEGAIVSACFISNHPDMLPTGDVAGAVLLSATGNPQIDFIYHHRKDSKEYTFSTVEIKKVLDEVGIDTPEVYSILHGMIAANLNEIGVN